MLPITDAYTGPFRKFEECVEAVLEGHYNGIGSVFTGAGYFPICGIDLDEETPTTRRVFDKFNSYTELSPGGKGCHIIIYANLPSGVHREGIEMYSSKRYFTFTGNVIRNLPITPFQDEAMPLWAELKRNPIPEHLSLLNVAPATNSDDEIRREIQSSRNYLRFWALINSDASALSGRDKSLSAIDMSIVNIIQKFTKNPDQIDRLWMATPQGGLIGRKGTPQAQLAYRQRTIKRSFDQEIKSIVAQWSNKP